MGNIISDLIALAIWACIAIGLGGACVEAFRQGPWWGGLLVTGFSAFGLFFLTAAGMRIRNTYR